MESIHTEKRPLIMQKFDAKLAELKLDELVESLQQPAANTEKIEALIKVTLVDKSLKQQTVNVAFTAPVNKILSTIDQLVADEMKKLDLVGADVTNVAWNYQAYSKTGEKASGAGFRQSI